MSNLITIGKTRWRDYLPSPTGLGIGMMVPGSVVFTMVLGGVLYSLWNKYNPRSAGRDQAAESARSNCTGVSPSLRTTSLRSIPGTAS